MEAADEELRRLAALAASPAACVAALASGQLPAALLRQLEAALASPSASPARLEQVVEILLQVMELEQQHGDDRVVQAAVAWASDTLLDLGRAIPVDEEQQESAALMRLQALSFTTSSVQVAASCDPISQLTPLLGDDGRLETMEPEAAAEVLDLCSTSIASDDEFLDATETLLSKVACVPLGDAFTRRMLNLSTQIDTQDSSGSDAMLLDLMPIEIKIRVWGNHLPSWTCQIERWFLAAHREPFHSIGSILAFNAPGNRKQDRAQIMGVSDWVKAFQNFSHLYVALILWLQDHFEVLDPVGMFDRSLVNNLWSANPSFWTATVRIQRFVVIGKNVERLSRTELTQATAVSEWVGVAERPHLILEAIEMLFDPQQAREEQSSTRAFSEDTAGKGVSGAVRLLGWFYANVSSFPPSEEISAIARSLRSNLAGVDLETGARWIQLHRGDFASTTTLRLRLVWFWLLQSVHSAESPLGDRREEGEEEEDTPNAAAVTSVLESVEYVFRKFTPPEHKRPYQVEVVAQFIVDFEWRCRAYWSTRLPATHSTMTVYVDRLSAIIEWLTKIVRIMEVEEAKVRGTALHDVQNLAERLRQLFAIQN